MKKISTPQNIKILTDTEITVLNYSYDFEIKSDLILVKSKKINRTVIHNKKEKFYLNTKISRITISPLAIQTWEYQFKNEGYTLFEVQNAINKLYVMYQEPSQNDISKLLKRNTTKITEIN